MYSYLYFYCTLYERVQNIVTTITQYLSDSGHVTSCDGYTGVTSSQMPRSTEKTKYKLTLTCPNWDLAKRVQI